MNPDFNILKLIYSSMYEFNYKNFVVHFSKIQHQS